MKNPKEIEAIDIHMHINNNSRFDDAESEVVTKHWELLKKIGAEAGIKKMFGCTFASVLSAEEVEAENDFMNQIIHSEENLYQWVVIEPRTTASFLQAECMLKDKKCVGIKLHPAMHKYQLEVYESLIFSFASDLRAPILIHPEKTPTYIVPIADRYPDVTIIIAHLGSKDYVDAVSEARYGNICVDTSGMASIYNQVIEYAVGRIGSERILFGTDTYAAGFQRGRIEYALISNQDKCNILAENAHRLFSRNL